MPYIAVSKVTFNPSKYLPSKALILENGRITEIKSKDINTNKKALVLLDGKIVERSNTEGTPLTYKQGRLHAITKYETLLI